MHIISVVPWKFHWCIHYLHFSIGRYIFLSQKRGRSKSLSMTLHICCSQDWNNVQRQHLSAANSDWPNLVPIPDTLILNLSTKEGDFQRYSILYFQNLCVYDDLSNLHHNIISISQVCWWFCFSFKFLLTANLTSQLSFAWLVKQVSWVGRVQLMLLRKCYCSRHCEWNSSGYLLFETVNS